MRYKERKVRLYFRGDAAFASPEIYEYLEAEGLLYVIRLKANAILQRNIAHLLTRPVGRPPDHVRRFHASFSYQAGSWNKKRRVVAKVEWHPGELVPRVGLDRFHRSSVTNLSRPTKRVVAFYNHRGTAEQHIKEGKNAINWTREEPSLTRIRVGQRPQRPQVGVAQVSETQDPEIGRQPPDSRTNCVRIGRIKLWPPERQRHGASPCFEGNLRK